MPAPVVVGGGEGGQWARFHPGVALRLSTPRARRTSGYPKSSDSGKGGRGLSIRCPACWARRTGRASAGSASDAGRARPNHTEGARARAALSRGGSTCRPGPCRDGGAASPGASYPVCPALQQGLRPHCS